MAASSTQVRDHLLHFLNSHNCAVKSGDGRKITHMRMDGGSYHIPAEAMGDFYRAYGDNLRDNLRLFFIEKNTDVFVLHFDVDFHSLLDEARTMAFCDVLHAAVNEYFAAPKKAIVCAILDEQGQRKGPGLHVLFPKAFVDADTACAVWAGVVARCEEKLPWGAEAWGTIIDVAVLREKGSLRMVGSDKCEKCANCGGDPHRRKCCEYCDAKGKLPCGKVYWPWRMLPDDAATRGELEDMRNNPGHAARRCSIQTARDKCSEDFQLPSGAPLPIASNKAKTSFFRSDEGAKLKKGAEKLLPPPAVLEALTAAVRSYDANFDQLVVRDVAKAAGRWPKCWIRVRGFNDRFCLNKCAQHNSNQIYFELSNMGLAQRCYSTKPVERAGGWQCSEFSGPWKPVPPALAAELLGVSQEAEAPPAPPAPQSAAPGAKRRKTNHDELVCYGGYYQVSPDAFI